jgi:HSP20 family protein
MPVTVATDPPFGNLARQMNKIMDQMHKGYYNFAPGETWTPSVNLYETDTGYLVCADLAGVEKDKIDITVEDHMLRLKGSRPVPSCADGSEEDLQNRRVRIHLMEIDNGSFSREVELPLDVQQDKISARYRNGLLWIELPKK